MLEYSFSVKHRGCWTADIYRDYPDVSATILHSHALSDISSTIIEAEDIDRQRAEEVVDWMSYHPVVQAVELVKHEDDVGLISLHTDFSDSDTQPVGTVFREQPCIPLASAQVRNGFEHCQLMMENREQVQATYKELQKFGPVEINSLNELKSDYHPSDLAAVSRAVSDLSIRQQEVLKRAIEGGYYDVPQSCTLEELATDDQATMSTLAEHLRHAENKVFDAIEPLLTGDAD